MKRKCKICGKVAKAFFQTERMCNSCYAQIKDEMRLKRNLEKQLKNIERGLK